MNAKSAEPSCLDALVRWLRGGTLCGQIQFGADLSTGRIGRLKSDEHLCADEEGRHTDRGDAAIPCQCCKPLSRGGVLGDVVEGNLKRGALTSKVVEEDLCRFTMRASGSDEHLDVRMPFSRPSTCPAAEKKDDKLYCEARQEAQLLCELDRHPTLTGDIRLCDGPNVGEHIQQLLIRQLPSKAMHGAEQHAVRDRHQEFPIGLGSTLFGLKIGRRDD